MALGAGVRTTLVGQGGLAVSDDPSEVLGATLGSCVATCLYDPTLGLGGMNHILLPDARPDLESINLMELLINELMRRGARRDRLRAKLFGGASMIGSGAEIGRRNSRFASEYLTTEGIPCLGRSLGGSVARRVRFWPNTGRAQQRWLNQTPYEPLPPSPKRGGRGAGEIDLF